MTWAARTPSCGSTRSSCLLTAGLAYAEGAAAFLERLWWLGVLVSCHETLGAAARLHEMTTEYAGIRHAFGRAIGSFQTIKHRLVDMRLWLETVRALVQLATSEFAAGSWSAESVSIAKAYLSEHAPVLARQCLQIHGGIGFTWEHDLHLYLRRVEANALLYGDANSHYDTIFQAVRTRFAGDPDLLRAGAQDR